MNLGTLRLFWARLTKASFRRCLRCKGSTVPAGREVGNYAYACPQCGRHYTLKNSGRLVFRWGHPISLVLYPVIFDEKPSARATEVAGRFVAEQSPEWQSELIREIELELREPTQAVRDILDCRGSEQELREFLRLVASHVAEALRGRAGRGPAAILDPQQE
jgi:hypothetical protein